MAKKKGLTKAKKNELAKVAGTKIGVAQKVVQESGTKVVEASVSIASKSKSIGKEGVRLFKVFNNARKAAAKS